MIPGYVTSGFGYHRLEDAIDVLANLGYRSVAITLDTHHLNPFDEDWRSRATAIRRQLERRRMNCTVETGARFLLAPRRKHHPTLISSNADDRARRIDFLCRAMDVAQALDADSVSLWSGAIDHEDRDIDEVKCWHFLVDGLREVLAYAERHDIPVGFEPEPGMLIERMADFEKLHGILDHPLFGLTLDVGHLECLADGDLIDHLQRWRHVLLNVHLEDMRRGVHEHLFFGEGDINFSYVINSLHHIGYRGPVHVELSRHAHDAPATAQRAFEFLSALWPAGD